MKVLGVTINVFSIIVLGILFLLYSSCKKASTPFKKLVFEENNISTEAIEYASSFSPSGTEVYFSKSNDKWGKGNIKSSIYFSVKKNQQWSKPKLASFSGQYDDSAPHITNNGKTLYFISQRPYDGVQQASQDIWKVERDKNNKWGIPTRLDTPINSLQNEYCIRTDKYGNLYFASDRNMGYGQGDLYIVKKTNNTYGSPINLGNPLNTEKGEWNLEVNKEGNIIIFEASERVENLSPYGDLYISFKLDGDWSFPQNIQEINTTGSDLYPELLEDHNILYFSSSDSLNSTQTNIYSIKFEHIYDKYKKSAVFIKD
ncbi:hypothetical protein [Aquimarina sp. 2201CG5-10]|uniref:hypothetical protein n=1 Tax=Aquimarina callyspongiae TaxID=3098150 RepID=UPI002AB5CB80|nr:hypothetical protein [Aquimarina sp. 2201CG5-10]MDY8137474.1 hypothetical protein [Aquimarina sp. 2201CG5-10]